MIRKILKQHVLKPYWNYKGNFIYYGQQVFFPKNSVIFQRAVTEGIYESYNLNIINTLIKPNTTIFDIGANIGMMSLPILYHNSNINLISVEASPNTLPYLKKTHQVNKNINRWDIVDKAVSDKVQKVTFQLANAQNGAYDSINDTQRVPFTGAVEIDCTTIDAIWRDKNSPQVSFIKIDIEGCDLLALRGGIDCIKACRPSILVEWNLTNIKAYNLVNNDFLTFFRSSNYDCFTVPDLNKITALNDLDLYSNFTENFLLIPASNT